ncbi:MAG: cyclase family protein [Planctomycetota bacterium]|nr:MAG: cyclase family protein [Planctomycetota bacterium]
MRFIDLSLPLEDDRGWAPWWARTRVKYQDHRFGRRAIRLLFGLGAKYLRGGLGWSNEVLKLSTHGTTHVDAPWHYAPVSEGRPARTIDEMPLDWFYDIVLIRTGNDARWRKREYYSSGPGVSAEATRWLIEQGVRLMGIDAWGWDRPLAAQAKEAKATGRTDLFWEAHYVGIDREYCQIERLANLDQLPPHGFTVCAFPLKVKRGSGGPARVVALLDG